MTSWGGRSGAYEKELRTARDIAFEEIVQEAQELSASAVVGVDIDDEVLGEKNGMLMVSISGLPAPINRTQFFTFFHHQATEAFLRCRALTRMTQLGMPESYAVAA